MPQTEYMKDPVTGKWVPKENKWENYEGARQAAANLAWNKQRAARGNYAAPTANFMSYRPKTRKASRKASASRKNRKASRKNRKASRKNRN